MLDFGWAELLILVAVAVFVIGPKDIPGIMYGLGRLVRRVQYVRFAISQQFEDIMNSGDIEELRKGINFEENRKITQNQYDEDAFDDEQELDIEAFNNERLSQIDNATDIPVLYKDIAPQYAQTFNEPSDDIDKFLNQVKKGGHILDAGCGVGVDANYMTEKGFVVTAVDFSVDMLDLAKKKYSNLNFQFQDIENLKFEDNTFDGILASYSLIHFKKSQIPSIIEKFSTLLKEDGILCLGFQSGEPAETIVPEPFNPEISFFLNVIGEDEITDILNQKGFDVLDVYKREFETQEELPYDKVCLVAQKRKDKK